MALMALFFLYLSNKLSVKSPDNLSHLSGYKNSQPGSQRSGQIGCTRGGRMFTALFQCYTTIPVLFLCSEALSLMEPNGIKRQYKCRALCLNGITMHRYKAQNHPKSRLLALNGFFTAIFIFYISVEMRGKLCLYVNLSPMS